MDHGTMMEDQLLQLTLAPTASSSTRRPAARRNSESSGGFRSGGSTATSSSGASLASNASSQSDGSHSSWGAKAAFLPIEAQANAGKISVALDKLPGCSSALRKVVQDLSLTYDSEVRESVAMFNDAASSTEKRRSRVQPVRPSSEEIPVVEALQQFWSIKVRLSEQRTGSAATSHSPSVVYEITKVHLRNGGYIAYATLPGGSCFASLQEYATQGEARRSAARVALMNSVLDELPSRLITDDYIRRVVGAAHHEVMTGRIEVTAKDRAYPSPLSTPSRTASHSVSDSSNCGSSESGRCTAWNALDVFHRILSLNRGNTQLEFKERTTVYQLFQWNGDIQQAKTDGLGRDAVLHVSLNTRITDQLRIRMASDWADLEGEHRGRITQELQVVNRELDRLRASGREIRVVKEKKEILLEAYAIYQRRQQRRAALGRGMLAELHHVGNIGYNVRSRDRRSGFGDLSGYSQASLTRTLASRY